MTRRRADREQHAAGRVGWLRAAVLGANDGILSVASIVVGVAGGGAARPAVLLAGLAGLVAGAMSMAAGEYVSVSSQADAEAADARLERAELVADPEGERRELAAIYQARGLEPALADEVAGRMMAHDALGAHLRDELGLTDTGAARPLQAAGASAASFLAGGATPVLVALLVPHRLVAPVVVATTLLLLAVLGSVGARAGGAPAGRGAARVAFWGAAAMAITWAIGRWAGTAI